MHITSDLMTIEELAEAMGVTYRTVERWDARRIGPPRIKIGKRVYYRADAVREWILSHEQEQVRAGDAA